MKKFLFTLAALMMMGTAYADDVITIPDQDLTAEQIAAGTITVSCPANFEHYVSAWNFMFTSLPEGLTVTSLKWDGNGQKITYLNEDGDEDQYRPEIMGGYPTWLAACMAMAYDEDGNYMGVPHWIGNYSKFIKITFAIDPNFAGGTIEYAVEPSAGGWGDHSNDCPKNSHYDLTCTFTAPGAPQLEDLTGEIVFGDVTEDGLLPVSYDGTENVTMVVTLNGETVELVDGNVQLVEGENAVVVTVSAEGYNDLVAEGTFTYTAPLPPVEVTATPTIVVTEGEEAYVITVVGDGELHLYANNVEVEFPFTVARGETDVTYYFTATAQEPGKEISETAELTVVVPAIEVVPPVEVPLSGDIEIGDVDPETGLLPVGYNGNEAGVTVTVTVNGEPVEVVNGLVQLVDGENVVVVTADGEGYEALTETVTVTWTAPLPPVDPHMQGYWLVILDKDGNPVWFMLNEGDNGDYVTAVALDYGTYGTFAPELGEVAPEVPFYFVVDGVVYGANDEYVQTVLGDAMENPLYGEAEGYYTVTSGYNYTLGIAITGENEFYVYASKAYPTGIDELNGGKTVAGVRYFNMAGQEMQEANGMTIIVTTYTDGTTSAVKVMK